MRPLNRPMRTQLLGALVAFALALGAVNATVAQADDLKDRQKKVQKDLSAASDDLKESSEITRKAAEALSAAQAQLAVAQGRLAQARAEVSKAAAEDARMQRELDAAIARLQAAKRALAKGEADAVVQQREVAGVITDIYQQGDPSLRTLSSLMGSATPEDLVRGDEVRDTIVGNETRAYADLVATRVLLEVKRRQVKEAKEKMETAREAAAVQLLIKQSLEAAEVSATAAVSELVEVSREAATEARKARKADEAELKKLEEESNQIKEQLARRAQAAGAGTTPVNSGGFLNPPISPVRVTSPFGFRTHPIYGYFSLHDGVDFGVGCGQPLFAGANGRVLKSYWSTAYGNRLLLDHGVARGVGLSTFYNHATSYVVGVGDKVKRGQVVGFVGSTGWSTGCHLHFTVLVNGSPVNPLGWM